MAPGKVIVVEGPEGVGKTTQILRLAERLKDAGIPHQVYREPGGSALGEHIRSLVLDPDQDVNPRAEALLFMAARAQLVQHIGSHLALGEVVLLDRFFLSTYAYQVAGRGLPETDVRAANALATGGLVPDLTILLHYPVGAGLERVDRRGERDRIERAGIDFHERVANAFQQFVEGDWLRQHPETGHVDVIDARGSIDAVSNRIWSLLVASWPETFAPQSRSHQGSR
jgi:dTMP kinase